VLDPNIHSTFKLLKNILLFFDKKYVIIKFVCRCHAEESDIQILTTRNWIIFFNN